MAGDSTWEPILDGTLAATARQAVRDVAQAIKDGVGVPARPTDRTLFWAYVAGAIEEDWVTECYDASTDDLAASIAKFGGFIGLHGGLAGVGWVISHVSEAGVADELLVEIDTLITRALDAERWEGDYDLISGLVGYGVYFLERGDVPTAKRGLARVLALLDAARERVGDGATWFTPPELLPAWQRELSPAGYFNCGLAHGVPGVIALLGRVAETGDETAAETCRAAMRWLSAQQIADGSNGYFPAAFRRDEQVRAPSRTAWCYGDPGVAIAGWGAAARLGLDPEPWRRIARETAARPFELTGVKDAALCHGAAGLAHIYNRWYQASREPVFRDAARSWFERALAMRRPDGVAGFIAWATDGSPGPGNPTWVQATDLVEGATGIALALLAAVEPTEPRWDRLFQCDLPIASI